MGISAVICSVMAWAGLAGGAPDFFDFGNADQFCVTVSCPSLENKVLMAGVGGDAEYPLVFGGTAPVTSLKVKGLPSGMWLKGEFGRRYSICGTPRSSGDKIVTFIVNDDWTFYPRQEVKMKMEVAALPEWVIGTFVGGFAFRLSSDAETVSRAGTFQVVVRNTGSVSCKLFAFGKTFTCVSKTLTDYDAQTGVLTVVGECKGVLPDKTRIVFPIRLALSNGNPLGYAGMTPVYCADCGLSAGEREEGEAAPRFLVLDGHAYMSLWSWYGRAPNCNGSDLEVDLSGGKGDKQMVTLHFGQKGLVNVKGAFATVAGKSKQRRLTKVPMCVVGMENDVWEAVMWIDFPEADGFPQVARLLRLRLEKDDRGKYRPELVSVEPFAY